ncbi:MAG: DUF2461 domain-containing protein [Ferruginibacter sp.]
MLQSTTLKFLTGLKKNNNKIWFEENRKQYDAAKADFFTLVESLIKHTGKFDSLIGNLAAKDCLFRINRDVRFSKDKSPYKNNLAGYFNKGGKKSNGAGYYIHIEPGKSFAGGGIWMPETGVLARIRQEIDYNLKAFKKIITSPAFKKTFAKGLHSEVTLSRPPKGYDELNPAIEYLKMKSFTVGRYFTDAEVQNKNFVKEVAKTFQAMKPLIDFLNTSLE